MSTLPPDIAAQVADQRARLAALAAERLADDLDDDDADPAAWRRRQADRAALEAACIERIAVLREGAVNDAARASARPVVDINRCAGCGRRTTPGADIQRSDGICCRGCAGHDQAQRALHRGARAVPAAELPEWIDALPDADFRELQYVVGTGPRSAYALRHEVDQAARRRRRRDAPRDGGLQFTRKRFARIVERATETSSPAVRAGWGAVNDALRPHLAADALVALPDMRHALDTLDRATLQDVGRLATRMRDHLVESVVMAEQRRRRTRGAPGAGPDAA